MMSPHYPKIFFPALLLAAQCHATSIAVVINGNDIVIAADSKQTWADPRLHLGEKREPVKKVVILNNRTAVAISGLVGNGTQWDALLFLEGIKHSLAPDTHVARAETVIMDKLKPYMDGFSSYMMNDPIQNKKTFPVLLLQFIAVGYENGIPVVDTIDVECDWNAGKATGPVFKPVYPQQDIPIDPGPHMMGFGQNLSINTAFGNPTSAERKAALDFAGLAYVFIPPAPKSMTVPQMINAASDIVRFETKFRPELVGTPINIFVLSGKNEPTTKFFFD